MRGISRISEPTPERPGDCRATSFDDLVGAGEHARRHFEAERFRSLEVDDQLILTRRLHRQIDRLLTFKDAVDVACRAPMLVEEIGPIGDQTAGSGVKAGVLDRGQAMLGRQRDDQIALDSRPGGADHDDAAVGTLRERRKAALDLVSIAHADGAQLHAK